MNNNRYCSKCKQIREIEDFGLNKKARNGRQHWCKECRNSYDRAKRSAKPKIERVFPRKTPTPPPNFYVYAYLRTRRGYHGDKGVPYYIGKGKDERAFSFQRGPKPCKDYSNVVFLASSMTETDALQAEMLLIRLYGRIDLGTGCLRNKTDGGDGTSGVILGKDHGRKISEAKKGIPRSEETKRKLSIAGKGKSRSSESRIKQSNTLKRKYAEGWRA